MTTDSLWLDSSIIRMGAKRLRELAQLAQEKQVHVLVHPHIHLEMCRYHRERRLGVFSQKYVDESLERLGITIADFTLSKQTADTYATILHKHYPTSADWKAAKLSSVRARLPEDATMQAEKIPMTTDWWVALEVEDKNGFIAVEDKGDEWRALREMNRAFSYDDCIKWLAKRNPVL